MTVHLIKLCVGVDNVEELAGYQAQRMRDLKAAGVEDPRPRHVTRNMPRRSKEVLAGGSLYWVIKRVVQVRQRIVALEKVEREDGKPACAIVLDPELVRTHPRGFRAFQGWRYFPENDAPADLPPGFGDSHQLPFEMAEELRGLGLI